MTWRCFALAALVMGAAPEMSAQAATSALPEYTNDQRWGRSSVLALGQLVSEIELGKARGMSVDEIGEWLGEYYARGWAPGLDARQLATSMRWNMLSDPDAKVEMRTFTDSLVVMRTNTPARDNFGPDGRYGRITWQEYQTVFEHINRMIAEHVGVQLAQRHDGDWVEFTMRTRYVPLKASDEIRWGRAAFVLRAVTIDVIRTGEAAGKSPREIGLATAKAWEDTWTVADTPWRLFRGIAYNNLTEPEYVCEVLSGSAMQVRARCNRPWLATVRANAQRSGVSVEDFEAYHLGLEQGLAASLGMTWDVALEGDARLITVRRK